MAHEFYLTDKPVDLGFKFICVEWFGNEIAGSGSDDIRIGKGAFITGYDHDFDIWIVSLDVFQKFHAVDIGHNHICEYNIKEIVFQLFNCLHTVLGCNIIMPENSHKVSQNFKN